MNFNPDIHHRRSIRLPGYDYSQAGAYFVTICTKNRDCLFGEIADGAMRLNSFGQIAQECWGDLPRRYPHVELDAFVVMPNHIHGIIALLPAIPEDNTPPPGRDAIHCVPANENTMNQGVMNQGVVNQGVVNQGVVNQGVVNQGVMNHAPTLGEIVRTFKATSTRLIHKHNSAQFAWQRNYYEHVIRDEDSLSALRQYTTENPLRWANDQENLINIPAERNICPSRFLPQT